MLLTRGWPRPFSGALAGPFVLTFKHSSADTPARYPTTTGWDLQD